MIGPTRAERWLASLIRRQLTDEMFAEAERQLRAAYRDDPPTTPRRT